MSVETLAPPAETLTPQDPVEQVGRIANQDPIKNIASFTGIGPEQIEALRTQAEMRESGGRVGIRMSEEAFTSMLGDGHYKTFRESGYSAGAGLKVTQEHGYRYARDNYEAKVFGQLPEDTPVVYGFLEEADTLTSRQEVKGLYGNIELILRPEARERTVFTLGESLGNYAAPLSYSDAILGRQALDTAKQRGEKIARGVDSYIEAQVLGGVTMDDVEMVAIDSNNLEKSMLLIDVLHQKHPDLTVMMRLPIDSQAGWREGSRVMELSQQYPFVQFVGQVEAESPFRQRNYFKEGVFGREEFIKESEHSYVQAKERVAQLRAKAAEYWQQEHPDEPFPSNVSFDMLTTQY